MLKPGAVLCGDVGSGKSRTAIAYFYFKVMNGRVPRKGGSAYSKPENPMPLYIITTAKKRDDGDWKGELAPFLLSDIPGEGPIDVFVDSWNNVGKYADVRGAFFIFDEHHLVGRGSWSKSFQKIAKANLWILLTATPGDTWMDYAQVFIANGFYKNITAFQREHVIFKRFSKYPQVERYVDESRLRRHRDDILVMMGSEKTATKHHQYVKVGYDEERYALVKNKRWNVFEDRPIRNASEYCYVTRKIANSDPRRIDALAHILESHCKLVVFYNFDYELEMLLDFAKRCNISHAEWNGHRHQPIPEMPSWLYFVQYTSGSEGWNCIETDTMVFFSQNYSYRVVAQSVGRIDRLNTPFTDLYYYHFFSEASIDRAIKSCLKRKKTFNEKGFAGTW